MAASDCSGRSAVVIVVDRLGAGFLGPYGNTWLDTPAANRLASRADVYEMALADAPDLPTVYRSFWTGCHAMSSPDAGLVGLPETAGRAGRSAVLFTDEPQIAGHPLAAGFAEQVLLPPAPVERAQSSEDSALGRFFIQAIEQLAPQREPALLWFHSRGLAGPWDGPLELRRRFADQEDPEPPDLIEPPEQRRVEGFDPDELLGLAQSCAGQVALGDECLGWLLEALDDHPLGDRMLVALTAPRGYPLGEHGRVGPCDQALYAELLHVPLVVRYPAGEHRRVPALVQPGGLHTILNQWFGIDSSGSNLAHEAIPAGQPLACSIAPGQRAVRTPAWFLRETLVQGEPVRELFAKPDDRWEANEVSSRCGDMVELLAAQLDTCELATRNGSLTDIPPLAESLTSVWR